MKAAGYSAVGEFHYLGLPLARAAVLAAREAELEIVVLLAAYARGGLDFMRQSSADEYFEQVKTLEAEGVRVGVAPHSVRACPREWLEAIGSYARERELVLHVHADEQPREIEECVAEHGMRPIELLNETGCLGPRTTVVHATHADGHELDLLAESGSRICICPTTEADLGDGFPPRSPSASAGSVSASARTQTSVSIRKRSSASWSGSRGGKRYAAASSSAEELTSIGGAEGAASLGLLH